MKLDEDTILMLAAAGVGLYFLMRWNNTGQPLTLGASGAAWSPFGASQAVVPSPPAATVIGGLANPARPGVAAFGAGTPQAPAPAGQLDVLSSVLDNGTVVQSKPIDWTKWVSPI